jgi:type I restriction enzyme S subunit
MGLSKLGRYIEQCDLRNSDGALGENGVVGLSTAKQIIPTKADLNGVNLTSYKVMPPQHFAYVPDTSRRGDKMSLGYNTDCQPYLVSSISVVFKVNETEGLLSDYLYLYFNRPEFDRYARFNSWGSAREAFSWEDMCDIEIDLPPVAVQQKYVEVYNAMLRNQRAYESGLEDLKLTCDAYIERLRREMPHTAIGEYLELCEE